MPFFRKGLLIGFVVLSLLFAMNQWHFSRYFPIRHVKIYGVNHTEPNELKKVLLPFLRDGFFAVNLDLIQERLSAMPWIAHLSVRRIWPDRVDIVFHEKKPLAFWNDVSLLSEEGELFIPKMNTMPDNLPHFIGPLGQQIIMLKYFQRIDRLLSALHVKVKIFELTPYFTWKLTLDNGIIMQIGYKDILTQLTHLVKVYPKIVGMRETAVDYIDLRYPNGMAVKWKAV